MVWLVNQNGPPGWLVIAWLVGVSKKTKRTTCLVDQHLADWQTKNYLDEGESRESSSRLFFGD
jgi:hypothetical protein